MPAFVKPRRLLFTVVSFTLSVSFGLSAAAQEGEDPIQFRCKIEGETSVSTPAKNRNPYDLTSEENIPFVGDLTSGAGALITVVRVMNEYVTAKDLRSRANVRYTLERYHDRIAQIRQLQAELDKTNSQIAALNAEDDLIAARNAGTGNNGTPARRATSLRALQVVQQAELQIAQNKKAFVLRDLIQKLGMFPASADENIGNVLLSVQNREMRARQRVAAARPKRFGTLGAGIALLVGGQVIVAESESLARMFSDLRPSDQLTDVQTKAVEQILDCTLIDSEPIEDGVITKPMGDHVVHAVPNFDDGLVR